MKYKDDADIRMAARIALQNNGIAVNEQGTTQIRNVIATETSIKTESDICFVPTSVKAELM